MRFFKTTSEEGVALLALDNDCDAHQIGWGSHDSPVVNITMEHLTALEGVTDEIEELTLEELKEALPGAWRGALEALGRGPGLVAQLSTVETLEGLCALLRELEDLKGQALRDDDRADEWDPDVMAYRGLDLSSLPTFGGEEPGSTLGVWSWDEEGVLVCDGGTDGRTWEVVPRGVEQ